MAAKTQAPVDPYKLSDLPTAWFCAGWPKCPFDMTGEALANCLAGCPLCLRVAVHPDGSETQYRLPAH